MLWFAFRPIVFTSSLRPHSRMFDFHDDQSIIILCILFLDEPTSGLDSLNAMLLPSSFGFRRILNVDKTQRLHKLSTLIISKYCACLYLVCTLCISHDFWRRYRLSLSGKFETLGSPNPQGTMQWRENRDHGDSPAFDRDLQDVRWHYSACERLLSTSVN